MVGIAEPAPAEGSTALFGSTLYFLSRSTPCVAVCKDFSQRVLVLWQSFLVELSPAPTVVRAIPFGVVGIVVDSNVVDSLLYHSNHAPRNYHHSHGSRLDGIVVTTQLRI